MTMCIPSTGVRTGHRPLCCLKCAASQGLVSVGRGRQDEADRRRAADLESRGALWITAAFPTAIRFARPRRLRFVSPRAFSVRTPPAERLCALVTHWLGQRVTPTRSASSNMGAQPADQAGTRQRLLRASRAHWRSRSEPHRVDRPPPYDHAADYSLGHRLQRISNPLPLARLAAAAGIVWTALTAEFAVGRIRAGPRTAREISTVLLTSTLIPPLAVAHRLRGEFRVRFAGRRAPGARSVKPRAVLFDRDGTLIEDVPYLADPQRVRPMPGARRTLDQLRRQGVAVGVVSNQSASHGIDRC